MTILVVVVLVLGGAGYYFLDLNSEADFIEGASFSPILAQSLEGNGIIGGVNLASGGGVIDSCTATVYHSKNGGDRLYCFCECSFGANPLDYCIRNYFADIRPNQFARASVAGDAPCASMIGAPCGCTPWNFA